MWPGLQMTPYIGCLRQKQAAGNSKVIGEMGIKTANELQCEQV